MNENRAACECWWNVKKKSTLNDSLDARAPRSINNDKNKHEQRNGMDFQNVYSFIWVEIYFSTFLSLFLNPSHVHALNAKKPFHSCFQLLFQFSFLFLFFSHLRCRFRRYWGWFPFMLLLALLNFHYLYWLPMYLFTQLTIWVYVMACRCFISRKSFTLSIYSIYFILYVLRVHFSAVVSFLFTIFFPFLVYIKMPTTHLNQTKEYLDSKIFHSQSHARLMHATSLASTWNNKLVKQNPASIWFRFLFAKISLCLTLTAHMACAFSLCAMHVDIFIIWRINTKSRNEMIYI